MSSPSVRADRDAKPLSSICSYPDSIEFSELSDEIAGCEDCVPIGAWWVYLRMCQTCGHVACCDSSPNRHASAYARSALHTRLPARPSPTRIGAGRWSWEEFRALPIEEVTVDIHCVTKWSKLDTVWQGVSVDTLLDGIETSAEHVVQFCDGGYTTNLPLEDVTGRKAWIAFGYDGEPLEPEHGGPARLLVPHLYFWKSAKWVRGLRLQATDEPGFWELNGYHNYGDPWRKQRYWGD